MLEFISEPLHREYELRLFRVVFQFLAQAGNVHVHGAGIHVGAIPHTCFSSSSRESVAPRRSMKYRSTGIRGQKDLRPCRPESLQSLPGHMDGPKISRGKLGRGTYRRATQQGRDAGHQFLLLKGFVT